MAAARANTVPGMVLSVFALTLLLSYWYAPPVTAGLERLGDIKLSLGWPFAVISTALFGGVIPWVVQRLRPAFRAQTLWSHLVFYAVFWGYKGFETNLFYDLQAWLFGHEPTLGVVIAKVLVDMVLWVTVWAVPTTVLAYQWKDARLGPGPRPLRPASDPAKRGAWAWYQRRCLPVIISNWAVWTPAVCVIYCLPVALQLPMQNLVLCFWSLLLVLQVSGPSRKA